MCKRAVILAGGKGTRLRPYTVVLPKPLMPVGEYSILEIIIKQLAYYGFNHITMAVNHQADTIKAYFQDGAKWSVKIDYSLEDMPLSTMGPLKLIPDLPENFLVMNGDILTDLNYAEFFRMHVDNQCIFTISSYTRTHRMEYGVLEVDESGTLVDFQEKPDVTFNVSMGIYAVSRRILEVIPPNQKFGFDHLMLRLIDDNTPANVFNFNGYWLDIGRPDDYMQAIDDFERMKSQLLRDD